MNKMCGNGSNRVLPTKITLDEQGLLRVVSTLFCRFECMLKVSPTGKITYIGDYPLSTTETGLKFVEEIERSGLLSKEQLEAFRHGNAERLLDFDISTFEGHDGRRYFRCTYEADLIANLQHLTKRLQRQCTTPCKPCT